MKLIDGEKLIADLRRYNHETISIDGLEMEIALMSKPLSADVQPVVRCKDCIYQTESWSGIKYCEAHGDHIGKDYDYCSNARMKGNG